MVMKKSRRHNPKFVPVRRTKQGKFIEFAGTFREDLTTRSHKQAEREAQSIIRISGFSGRKEEIGVLRMQKNRRRQFFLSKRKPSIIKRILSKRKKGGKK